VSQKGHGTSKTPVQQDLRWGCAPEIADNICNFNRHYAERAGYWERSTRFLREERERDAALTFYDSNTGAPLFTAPRGRRWADFLRESRAHGWPSFRDDEVNWQHVRVLPDGECVSTAGTHLGTRGPSLPLQTVCPCSHLMRPLCRPTSDTQATTSQIAPATVTVSAGSRMNKPDRTRQLHSALSHARTLTSHSDVTQRGARRTFTQPQCRL
jgi:hypothetical protein